MKRRTVLSGIAVGAVAGVARVQLAHAAGSALGAAPALDLPSRPVGAQPPVTVPAVQTWTARSGHYRARDVSVVVDGGSDLLAVGTLLADELGTLLGGRVPVRSGPSRRPGAVVLRRGDQGHGPESYRIDVGTSVVITGTTAHGAFNGTRTLLQWLTQGREIPGGTTVDWPVKEVRSLLVDNTPRHFSLQWWENMFRVMSWFKINDTNLYIDGCGMGPGEARLVQELADRYFINLVPQLNMPAHMHVMLASQPQYQLVNKDGSRNHVALDLTNPEAVDWALGLLEPWLTNLKGTEWHLGSDEYPGWPGTGADHPQLDAYAKQRFGAEATFADLFADFQNRANALVKQHGRRLRVWNDMIRRSKVVQLDRDVTVEYWIQHDALPGELSAQELSDRGNPLINCHIDRLYYDQSRHNLDPQDIWDRFERDRFPFDQVVTPSSRIRGARVCVWLAWIYTPMESDAEVLHNLVAPLQAFGQEVWGSPRPVKDYAEFAELARRVGLPAGRHPDGPDSLTGRPAATLARDGGIVVTARDARGRLWAAHQDEPGLMHWSSRVIAEGVVGDPDAATGVDGRVRIVARTASQVLLAVRGPSDRDGFAVRPVATGPSCDPVIAGATASVVLHGGKLLAIDAVTRTASVVAHGVTGRPSVTVVGDRSHIVCRTATGLVHVWGSGSSWQVEAVKVRLTADPLVVPVGADAHVVVLDGSVLRVGRLSSGGGVRRWDDLVKDAAGRPGAAVSPTKETHLAVRTTSGGLTHLRGTGGTWTVRHAGDGVVDDPAVGFNEAGRAYLLAHAVRQTLRVFSPKDGSGEYEWADLAESQESSVTVATDGKGLATWMGTTTYGHLLAGACWGGIGDWGRDIVLGTYAYPEDGFRPDRFTRTLIDDTFDTDSGRYRVLKPSAGEAAPQPEVSDGALSVAGSHYFTWLQSDVALAAGPTTVIVDVDHWLEASTDQNTLMVGFARDEKNYVAMWVVHRTHRIGFDTVSGGRLMPDGAGGHVPFPVMAGDRIAVTLVDNWLIGYVERGGVWYRVHTCPSTSTDNLRDPAVRSSYRASFALRGDEGRLAVGRFHVATS